MDEHQPRRIGIGLVDDLVVQQGPTGGIQQNGAFVFHERRNFGHGFRISIHRARTFHYMASQDALPLPSDFGMLAVRPQFLPRRT